MRGNLLQPDVRRPGGTGAARIISYLLLVLLVLSVPVLVFGRSGAVLLTYRKLQLSDASVAATGVKYNFTFNTNTSGPIGSLTFRFCENYLYNASDACTTANGFTAAGATLSGQSGISDFTLNPASTDNKLIVSRPAATPVSPQQLVVEFSGITNPADVGSYYVRMESHASTDASDAETDYGNVVFATTSGIGIQTEVPPYLLFCTGVTIQGYNCGTAEGSFISFGELSSKSARTATSQLLASTNAPYGYSVTLAGSTMTAGTNVIPAMSGQASKPGSSQFGINSRSNNSPGVGNEPDGPGLTIPRAGYNAPNIFRFNSGDIIASSNDTDDYRKLTVSYIVNASAGQPPGRYVATISYICLANF